MSQPPKLKGPGALSAHASPERPTKRASDFNVAWISGLKFRNSDATAALCVTRVGKDPARSGLHLDLEAAGELAGQLRFEAAKGAGAVTVMNRAGGEARDWQTFVDQDALVLADRIAGMIGTW